MASDMGIELLTEEEYRQLQNWKRLMLKLPVGLKPRQTFASLAGLCFAITDSGTCLCITMEPNRIIAHAHSGRAQSIIQLLSRCNHNIAVVDWAMIALKHNRARLTFMVIDGSTGNARYFLIGDDGNTIRYHSNHSAY